MKYDMLYVLCSAYKILQFVYFIYIYFYFFIFCARNIQTIICHRSYVYIFGLEWFHMVYICLNMISNGLYIDLSILSPVRTVMYIIFFMYMNQLIKFDLIIIHYFLYMNVCSFFIYIYNCFINYIIPLYSIYPHHYLFFI